MGSIVVVGGSGFVGRRVTAALLDAGQIVTAPAHADFDIAREDASALAGKLAGAEIVVNCAGLVRDSRVENLTGVNAEGARRLGLACAQAGVKRLVHISALGAGAGDSTRFQRSKGEGERALSDIEGVRVVIVRPSLVLGAGGATGDFFSALSALPIPPRLAEGNWRLQPLHVLELAELVVRLALDPDPPASVDAVGPRPITTDELTTNLRAWLKLKAMPALTMPRAILNVYAWANEIVEMGPGDRDLLDLLERGNVGDPAGVTAALGRAPLSLAESLKRRPATIADLWRARLYFLHPLLRLTLALLWLGTGLVSFGLYPPTEFFVMLGELGLTGATAQVALFGAAAVNCGLGFLLLVNWRPVLVAQGMLLTLILFSAAALLLPHEYWLTPFAPILKNAPIAVALLTLIGMERPNRQAGPASAPVSAKAYVEPAARAG
jgi:nucleoside-diphosphate-sugar epimerase